MASAVAPVGSSNTIATVESTAPETDVEPPQPMDTLASVEQPVAEPSDPVANSDTLAKSSHGPRNHPGRGRIDAGGGEDAQTSSDETVLEVAETAAAPETEGAAESTLSESIGPESTVMPTDPTSDTTQEFHLRDRRGASKRSKRAALFSHCRYGFRTGSARGDAR